MAPPSGNIRSGATTYVIADPFAHSFALDKEIACLTCFFFLFFSSWLNILVDSPDGTLLFPAQLTTGWVLQSLQTGNMAHSSCI